MQQHCLSGERAVLLCPLRRASSHVPSVADAAARCAFALTPQAAALEAEAEAEAAAGEDAEISANPPPPFSANPPPPEAPMKRSTSESDLSAFDPVSALKTARSALVAGHFSPRSQSPIT